LRDEQDETAEAALWASVVALENAASVADRLGPEMAEDARSKRAQADAIRKLLEKPERPKR
jgi:hypothetical protein